MISAKRLIQNSEYVTQTRLTVVVGVSLYFDLPLQPDIRRLLGGGLQPLADLTPRLVVL